MSARITYGRRALKRQRRAQEYAAEDAELGSDHGGSPGTHPSPDPDPRARKRPKMIMEVVLPVSPRLKTTPSPPKRQSEVEDSRSSPEPLKHVLPQASSAKASASKSSQGSWKQTTLPRASSAKASTSKLSEDDERPVQHRPFPSKAYKTKPPDAAAIVHPHPIARGHTPPIHRKSSPAPATPSRTSVTYLSRTPVKASASLPIEASSPLTPVLSTPLKRNATFPVDPPSPKTPTRKGLPAKDLSGLFDFLPSTSESSISSKPEPKAVAKRMLARTRTEPIPDGASGSGSTASVISISSTSSPKRVGSRTDTLIDLTSSATASAMSSMTSEDQGPRPGPSTLVAPQPSIRTYAGKSRSFLVPLPSGPSGLAGGLADDDLGLEVRESYTDLRTRWGVDNSEDDPRPVSPYGSDSSPEHPGRKSKGKERASKVVLAPGMMNDLKSITELRSKGESRRFMDEVGYLFEGMDEGASIGVRRSSALEIVTKLCDVDFARRAKATDFLTRAWDVLRGAGAGDGDKILDAILVLFAACAAESPQDLLELVQLPDFVPTLWRVLPSVERAKDALQLVQSGLGDFELKKAGISKAEKIMLRSLFSIIVNKSGLAPTDACPALRQLLTQALAKVPPSLHQPSAFVTLHKSLIAELSLVPSRLVAYDAGLPLIPDPAPPGFAQEAPELAHIEACLVILDAFLLGRWAESDERPSLCDDVVNGEKQEELIDGLMSLCVACNAMLRGSADDDLFDMADKCLESTLRVLINLSHENTVWCRHLLRRELTLPVLMSLLTVAQRQSQSAAMEVNEKKPVLDLAGEGIIDDDTDQQAKAFDRLCLALGLLTNLVQVDDDAKDLCRATRLSPSCPGSRSCFRTCRCTSRINALDALVGVYLHYRKSDADHDEAAATIVRGHLAILFGLLMRGSAPNTRAVLDALPGVTRRAKLDGLLSNAREFVGVYAEFMVRVARGEGAGRKDREDEDEEEREREEERHRDERAVRDGASEGVARDVIGFLESLRDE